MTTETDVSNSNDSLEAANAVSLNDTVTGALSSSGDKDFFSFAFSVAGIYTVTLTTTTQSTSNYYAITTYDSSGDEMDSESTGQTLTYTIQVTSAGTYYLGLSASDLFTTENYQLNVALSTQINTMYGNDDTEDILYGTSGQYNYLSGGSGDDKMIGQEGNDTLIGGLGNDTMIGGAGNDTYYVNTKSDVIVEKTSSGTDTIISTYNISSLMANIENIELNGSAKVAYGNTLDNLMTGNALNNTIRGQEGNDSLDGGLGNDTMYGGAGDDVYYVNSSKDVISESSGYGDDTVYSSASTYTLSSYIENITLVDTAKNATGNSSANNIIGNEYSNNLAGKAGNDSLSGMAGNDALTGGAGNDTMSGGDGSDIFVFDTTLSASSNVDIVTDFNVSTDNILLSEAIFSQLDIGYLDSSHFYSTASSATEDTNDYIIYNASTGDLYYDKDGSGTKYSAVKFASILNSDAPVSLTSDHFVVS